jgi:hypothetical protein
MINNFTSCNKNCVQPYVFGLLVLSMIVISLVATITAFAKGRSSEGKSFLYALIGSLVGLIIIWFLLKWLCNNNHRTVAWLVAVLPLILPGIYGYYFGVNAHFSWECSKKLRNTMYQFKCKDKL